MEQLGISLPLGAAVLVLILFDIVAGIVKAFATNTFASSAMREGLWHKAGTIMILALAAASGIAGANIEEFPTELGIVYVPTCLYIIAMEIASILENILVINPDLDRFKIFEIFKKNTGDENAD